MPRNHNVFVSVGMALTLALSIGASPGDSASDMADTGTVSGQVVFPDGAVDVGLVPTDAVIYLVGDGLESGSAFAAPDGATLVLDQRDIKFVPHVVVAPVGTGVEIRNSDALVHNVHTRSRENRPFNRSQLANMKFSVDFDRSEVITVSCDIHSQMSAFIVVTPNGFFARAQADGTYAIADVPEGTYQIVGWHEKYGSVSSELAVVPGRTTQVELDFASAQR
jgi:plastocyanin